MHSKIHAGKQLSSRHKLMWIVDLFTKLTATKWIILTKKSISYLLKLVLIPIVLNK